MSLSVCLNVFIAVNYIVKHAHKSLVLITTSEILLLLTPAGAHY